MLKKGGLRQFADLRGGAWQERGCGVFEGGGGGDTRMHTMIYSVTNFTEELSTLWS